MRAVPEDGSSNSLGSTLPVLHYLRRNAGARSALVVIAGLLLLAPGVACKDKSATPSGGSSGTSSADDAGSDASKGGAAAKPEFGTAVITGTIVLEGKPPAKKKITMTGDRVCKKHSKKHVAPKFEVGDDGGLPHVFVYIKKGIRAKYPPPEESVTLDQSGCMYHPHVFGLQVGQNLRIKNNDNTAHNINSIVKKNDKFNISQPQKGMTDNRKFKRPEVMVTFKCDVHGWMNAHVGILNHPFFAVTDENGKFSIEKLPPGKYTIETWHELYGRRTAELEIADGEAKEVNVTYKKRK